MCSVALRRLLRLVERWVDDIWRYDWWERLRGDGVEWKIVSILLNSRRNGTFIIRLQSE